MNYINLNTVKEIKEYIEMSLSEVAECNDEFNDGQRHAYIETLELLQSRLTDSERREAELDYSVEGVYPLRKMPL